MLDVAFAWLWFEGAHETLVFGQEHCDAGVNLADGQRDAHDVVMRVCCVSEGCSEVLPLAASKYFTRTRARAFTRTSLRLSSNLARKLQTTVLSYDAAVLRTNHILLCASCGGCTQVE